jgi:hypothetical protein
MIRNPTVKTSGLFCFAGFIEITGIFKNTLFTGKNSRPEFHIMTMLNGEQNAFEYQTNDPSGGQ